MSKRTKPSKHRRKTAPKTTALRQKLRGLLAMKGWTEEEYRSYIYANYSVTSCTQMSDAQLIEAIRKNGGRAPKSAPKSGVPDGPWIGRYQGQGKTGYAAHATQTQLEYVAYMEDAVLGWWPDRSRLEGYMRRTLKLPANVTKTPEMMSVREATKLINALKSIAGTTQPKRRNQRA